MEVILTILVVLGYIILIPLYVVSYSLYILVIDGTLSGVLHPIFILGIIYLIGVYYIIKKYIIDYTVIFLKRKLWK